MKKGDVIGISSLGNRQDFFPTEIIAVKDSRVLIIENKEYINILKSDTMLLDNYFTYVSEKYIFKQEDRRIYFRKCSRKISVLFRKRKD